MGDLKKVKIDNIEYYYPVSELERWADIAAKEFMIGISAQPVLNTYGLEPAWFYEKTGKKRLDSGRDILINYSSSLVEQYLKTEEYDPGKEPFKFFERLRFKIMDKDRHMESAVIDRLEDNPDYSYLYVFDNEQGFMEKYKNLTENSYFLLYFHMVLDGSLDKEEYLHPEGRVHFSSHVPRKRLQAHGNLFDLMRVIVKYDSSN